MLKKLLFIFILSPIFLFSQENIFNENEIIYGIITSEKGTYLVLEKGLMRITENDSYIEYYKNIYNDSTIVNPNTEIKNNINLNIIPFLSPQMNQQKFDFSKPLQMGIFIQTDEFGFLNLTPYAKEYLDSIRN